MSHVMLFIDGSVNTETKTGYGAYLIIENQYIKAHKKSIKTKRFKQTSSTKLELQNLLWALNAIEVANRKIVVYTDSQNIIGLPERRAKLEQNNYYSSNGRRLNHYELYQAFYKVIDQINCEFVKIKGHLISTQKDNIDRLFTMVDRAARKELRKELTGAKEPI